MSISRIPASPAVISGGRLLAQTAYTPGSDGSYTTTSSAAADIDATNLAVTFVAPASGKVNVYLQALTDVTSGQDQQWGLRQGTTDVFPPRATFIGTGNYRMMFLIIPMTGLTPGTVYTYKWSWKTTGGTATLYNGPTRQIPVMQVYDASTDTSPAYGGNSWESAVAATVSGLVHRWRFDETSGATVADSVGSLPLTLSGTYTRNITDTPPGLGVATNIASTGKALASGLGSVPVTSAARTVLAVARTTGHQTAQSILADYGVAGSRTRWAIIINNGGTTADDGGANGATAFQVPGAGFADGNWHLIGAAYATQMLSSVVDGRQFSAHDSSAENTTASGNFTVGQDVGGTNQFLGDIADLLVWNRKLAPYELNRLYAGMRGAA